MVHAVESVRLPGARPPGASKPRPDHPVRDNGPPIQHLVRQRQTKRLHEPVHPLRRRVRAAHQRMLALPAEKIWRNTDFPSQYFLILEANADSDGSQLEEGPGGEVRSATGKILGADLQEGDLAGARQENIAELGQG